MKVYTTLLLCGFVLLEYVIAFSEPVNPKLPYLKPWIDKRCPKIRPNQVGICIMQCSPFLRRKCAKGYICCPTGCGMACKRIVKPNLTTKPPRTTPKPGYCKNGKPIVRCKRDPCDYSKCPRISNAKCRADYCGGCNARFYVGKFEVTKLCKFRLPVKGVFD